MSSNKIAWGIIMTIIYSQIFANSCHNGFVDALTSSNGTLRWEKQISQTENVEINARTLLTADGRIFVVGIASILAFDQEGGFLWEKLYWPATPVVIQNDLLYYSSAEQKSMMEAVDFHNHIKVKDFPIPDVGDESFLVLFQPIKQGLIAQVQYGPDPDDGEIDTIIYRTHVDSMMYEWSRSFHNEKSRLRPLVNFDRGFLVSSTSTEALIFNLDNSEQTPEPEARFPFPLGENTMWMSSDQKGNLFWAGHDNGYTILTVTDSKGKEVWKWRSERFIKLKEAQPVAPPIITQDRVYMLTQKRLTSIIAGKSSARFEIKDGQFLPGIALGDNSVLLASGKQLYRVDSNGQIIFEVEVDETIVTSPVVDKDGNIYIASSEKLYAIH